MCTSYVWMTLSGYREKVTGVNYSPLPTYKYFTRSAISKPFGERVCHSHHVNQALYSNYYCVSCCTIGGGFPITGLRSVHLVKDLLEFMANSSETKVALR